MLGSLTLIKKYEHILKNPLQVFGLAKTYNGFKKLKLTLLESNYVL